MDIAKGKVIKLDKRNKEEEKEGDIIKDKQEAKAPMADIKSKEKAKPVAEVSFKEIEKDAKKAHKAIAKNEVKAKKAES